MIKFFRRIRQRLLAENKFSKYLIYAIGEIALVMIGILLALQVNNWNEKRKTINSEKALLINFIEELESDIDVIESHQSQLDEINNLHTNLYLIGVEKKESVKVENPNNVRLVPPYGILSNDNYPNIVSEISNTNVRNSLTRYFMNMELYRGVHMEILEIVRGRIRPFLGTKLIYDAKEWYSNKDNLEQSKFVSKERLLKLSMDPGFQQLLLQANLKVMSMKSVSERLIQENGRVKQVILSELNNY